VFENRVLRRDEVTGGWRKLHNKELHNLYSSPNIIKMIKTGMIRCAGHVARKGEMRNAYKVWLGILKGGDRLEDLGVYGRIILKCILEK
jgi:hypothetical protein